MNILLIVETPSKAKILRQLFPEFTVLATLGQFVDLPPEGMGTRLPEHLIQYALVDGKQHVVSNIRSAALAADVIYVATNPDREGEAIAAHVVNILDKPYSQNVYRIIAVELTVNAIQNAIINKRGIDWSLVRAYEAQRVIERYIGFLVSSELTNKFTPLGLNTYMTAGRVQSVALKLIVERQLEIETFIPVERCGVTAVVEKSGIPFEIFWNSEKSHDALVKNEEDARAVIANTDKLIVLHNKTRVVKVSPPQPLTMTSYLRLTSAILKLTTKQAMDAAQKLYEHGLITYHRTDSLNISPKFVTTVHEFAREKNLPLDDLEMTTSLINENVEQSCECLRVTNINLISPLPINTDDYWLYAVYRLIWVNTLESQLANGSDVETCVTFENKQQDTFVKDTRTINRMGWREAARIYIPEYADITTTEKTEGIDMDSIHSVLSELREGDSLNLIALHTRSMQIEPPEPFTEFTLIDKLNTLGVGRPNIYADTIERIIKKQYVGRVENTLELIALSKGIAIIQAMDNQFSFINDEYAATLETAFHKIAMNETNYSSVVNSAWLTLDNELAEFKQVPLPIKTKRIVSMLTEAPRIQRTVNAMRLQLKSVNNKKCSPGEKCPDCQKGNLRVSHFTQGDDIGKPFVACSIFPDCHYFQMVQ